MLRTASRFNVFRLSTVSRKARLVAALGLFCPLAAGLLTGCDGSSTQTASTTTGRYTGNYASNVNLAEGQTGALSLNVVGDKATGTFAINDPNRAFGLKTPNATGRGIVAKANLIGNVDLGTGQFSVSGSITVNGQTFPINVSGTLPAATGLTGQVNFAVNGTNYTSTVSGVAVVGNPGGTTNTGNGTPQTPSAGDGKVHATLSNATGTNADTSAFTSVGLVTDIYPRDSENTSSAGHVIIAATDSSGVARAFSISIFENDGLAVAVGKAYSLSNDINASGVKANIKLEQVSNNVLSVWRSTTGSVVVDSIENTVPFPTVKFHVTGVTMAPAPDGAGNATGTFNLNISR